MKPNTALAVASACSSLLACGGESVDSATDMREPSVDDASTPSMPMGVGGEGNGGSATVLEGCELVEFESPPGDCDEVVFGSPAIEAHVRQTLAQLLDEPSYAEDSGPLPGDVVAIVTGVVIGPAGASVDDLSGIECLAALEWLSIETGGSLSSIEALRELERLEIVELPDQEIADLSPLDNKPSLTSLDFENNSVESLAGLALSPSPDERGCPGSVILRGNPIDVAQAQLVCDQGWALFWDGEDAMNGAGENCSRAEWTTCYSR